MIAKGKAVADKSLNPEEVARRLEELQRRPTPHKKTEKKTEDDNPEGPIGGAPVPAPVKPVPPTLSGKSANPLTGRPEAGEQAA